jgi:hypothetical protein
MNREDEEFAHRANGTITASACKTAPHRRIPSYYEFATHTVETRLGTLKFFDGFPDEATVQKVYDNLDFQRGVQAFLNTMPAAGLYATRKGFGTIGPANQTVIMFESLMDSKSLVLTANTETIYNLVWLDSKNGPLVIEIPPNVLGMMDDFWQRPVVDVGRVGPDKGKGGKYLLLPPGYKGEVPEGYFVVPSPTFGNFFFFRGFLVDGDLKPALDSIKKHTRVYPLAQTASPPVMKFLDASGLAFDSIHSRDFSFFEEVKQVVQEEPVEAMDSETLGLLASIGIQKGKPFAPDARMRKILIEAAAVGNATARALSYSPRDARYHLYPNSGWVNPFISGHHFLNEGARNLDARTFYYFLALGISPAQSIKMVGAGSQYTVAFGEPNGNPFDGGKTYKLHLPPNVPAKDFWSLVLYDLQTRSMLQTDMRFPSISSQKKGVVVNPDTSVDVYFGPKAPKGKESNWLQTVPGKGWFTILRLYGPLEPWFDKTWKPGEFEMVK